MYKWLQQWQLHKVKLRHLQTCHIDEMAGSTLLHSHIPHIRHAMHEQLSSLVAGEQEFQAKPQERLESTGVHSSELVEIR